MKILLIDDEPLVLEKLRLLVAEQLPDAELHAFSRPRAGLDFAAGELIDVAFLDINMRTVSGIAVAQWLQERNPQINIIFCTGYPEYALDALDLHCSGYLLKPATADKVRSALSHLRYPPVPPSNAPRVRFRCFGSFEVFIDGVPLHFKYEKTRELLAYLVDRAGALCSHAEIGAVLWEDDMHEEYLKSLRRDLIRTFEDHGCDDVLLRQRGKLAVMPEKVSCDYFDWRAGRIDRSAYAGEYMAQYSWAEYMNGSFLNV